MSIYLPYTYLIKHIPTEQYYYGVRWANVRLKLTPEEDLWVNYFTNSKIIKKLIKQYGKDSFLYEVRKTFDSIEKAREWETKVLCRLNVLNNQNVWLNKTNNKAILNKTHPKGTLGMRFTRSLESKNKMSISAKNRGSNRTGTKHSLQAKKNISEGLLSKPYIKCPHCEISSRNMSNMKRYHLDMCKFKKHQQ